MTKRILYGAAALVVATALAVGGTFAWQQWEHKSNVLQSNAEYQARLVENFEEKEWAEEIPIAKEISVANLGDTEQFKKDGAKWGDIYVRLQLKEHLDITPIEYVYYTETVDSKQQNVRFMVDKEGLFVRVAAPTATPPTRTELLAYDWSKVIADTTERAVFLKDIESRDWTRVSGLFDVNATTKADEYYWYLPTVKGDPNGQYGAAVVIDRVTLSSAVENVCGCPRATDVDYTNYEPGKHPNEECDYKVHMWEDADPASCALDTHKYVSWQLSAFVITKADWVSAGKKPVDKWILDTDTGWAYWGNAITANDSTELLLETITPLIQPDGEVFYVIHVDMEAANKTDMQDDSLWDDEWVIKDIFETAENFKFGSPTNHKLKTSEFSPNDTYTHPDTADALAAGKTVVFSTDPASSPVASVHPATGEVTLLGGAGSVKIVATITPEDGTPYDVSYTITVEDDSTPALPKLTAVNDPLNKDVLAANFSATTNIDYNGGNAGSYTLSNWDSDRPAVASVTSTGVVDILTTGTTEISALVTPNDGTAPYYVKFNLVVDDSRPPLPTLEFDGTRVPIEIDVETYNTATPIESTSLLQKAGGGAPTISDYTINWTSSDPTIATVNNTTNPGRVTINNTKKEGSTTITATVTPSYGALPYTISYVITTSSDLLTLKNQPDSFPTDVDVSDAALASLVLCEQVPFKPNGSIVFYPEGNDPAGYGYFSLRHFLSDEVLASGTPIEVIYVSSGVPAEDADRNPIMVGGVQKTAGVIPAANVKVVAKANITLDRMSRIMNYTNEPCIVIDKLFTKDELLEIPRDYSFYVSELTIKLKQGDKISEEIKLPIRYECQIAA